MDNGKQYYFTAANESEDEKEQEDLENQPFDEKKAMDDRKAFFKEMQDTLKNEQKARKEKSRMLAVTQFACLGAGVYAFLKDDYQGASRLVGSANFVEFFTATRGDMVGASSSLGSVGLSGLGVNVEAGLSHVASGLGEWQPVSVALVNRGPGNPKAR